MTIDGYKSRARAAPDIIVDPSTLFPPLSGVGYYTREILKAYCGLPGHFPVKLLSFRFFLKSGRRPPEADIERLAESWGGSLDVRFRPVPSLVYGWLRRRGLRPPFPLDMFESSAQKIYFFPNFVGEPLLRARYVPVVFDVGFLRHPGSQQNRDHLYLKRYLPRALRRASRVVVISECVKWELQKAYDVPADKIAVITPAVDHAAFRPDIPAEVRAAVREKYGLGGGYIFSLSTLEPRKNFPRLIEAYSLLPGDAQTRLPLVVAGGSGWKNEEIYATIRRLGLEKKIKFLGYISEMDRAPLMREAALFVLPSLYEGFGMPVLEAMACGTPVVTSARGAIPEIGGDAVVYADPLRAESIARSITTVLEDRDLRTRLSASGISRAASFRWLESARGLADVFERVA
ncbi:MAG: glycosyltransferase family 1 protein [Candidatus Aminicenantales bacterium]